MNDFGKPGTNYFGKLDANVNISQTNELGFATKADCNGNPNIVALHQNVFNTGCEMIRNDILTGNNIYSNQGTVTNPSWIQGSGGGVWGTITGTLSNQTDLQNALNLLVPYTGATTDLNMGGYDVTATNVVATDKSYATNGFVGTGQSTFTNENTSTYTCGGMDSYGTATQVSDSSGNGFDYQGVSSTFQFIVYPFKNISDAFYTGRVYGTSKTINFSDSPTPTPYKIQINFHAVVGANGYRVVIYDPINGYIGDYSMDIPPNTAVYNNASILVNSSTVTPTSPYTVKELASLFTGAVLIQTSATPISNDTTSLLQVGGDIRATGNFITDGSYLTSTSTQLDLRQTGDQYGASNLQILNRDGANGATLENEASGTNPAAGVIDFNFQVHAGYLYGLNATRNMRMETRSPFLLSGNSSEFQLGNTSSGWFAQLGDTNSILRTNLQINGNLNMNGHIISDFLIGKPSDITSRVAFDLTPIPTGTLRNFIFPNRDIYLDTIKTTTETNGTGFLKGNGANISFDNSTYQTSATNLTSLAGLSYASASFVKMTSANTFTLDTNTYLTSLSGALLATGSTTGATSQAQEFTKGITINGATASLFANFKATTAAIPAASGSSQSSGGILRFTSNSAAVLDFGTAGSTGGWIQSALGSSLATNYPLLLNPNGGGVAIGKTSGPVASAILELPSTTQGVLFPRMTTTQKAAISSPATGLVVYDTTLNKLCVFTGTVWETVTSL